MSQQQGTSPQNHPSLCASSIAFSILSIESMFASVSSCLCWWNKIANFVSKLRNCSLKAFNWTKNMRTIILFMLGWERNLVSLLIFYKKIPKVIIRIAISTLKATTQKVWKLRLKWQKRERGKEKFLFHFDSVWRSSCFGKAKRTCSFNRRWNCTKVC